jgi:hypothetical protein|tara:strand:+ start:2317 stop:2499 length:183 start_codon:yes stop_codon:yes gene_type:complete
MEGAISSFQTHLSYLIQSNKALRKLCGEVLSGLTTLEKTDLTPEQTILVKKLKERLKETQ